MRQRFPSLRDLCSCKPAAWVDKASGVDWVDLVDRLERANQKEENRVDRVDRVERENRVEKVTQEEEDRNLGIRIRIYP